MYSENNVAKEFWIGRHQKHYSFLFFKLSLLIMASNSKVAKVVKSAKLVTGHKWET